MNQILSSIYSKCSFLLLNLNYDQHSSNLLKWVDRIELNNPKLINALNLRMGQLF